MTIIHDIADYLDQLAPIRLAEDWDNVGLLVGDAQASVERVMTCLTITPASAAEAIAKSAQLIVTHHPLPFRPLKRLTADDTSARLLWDLIRAGVAIYSPHTGFDSAAEGINQAIAQRIGLTEICPLVPRLGDPDSLGAGRVGLLVNKSLAELIADVKQQFHLKQVQYVGDLTAECRSVAIACGSGGSFLAAAEDAGCNTFVSGEMTFHMCLEAKAKNISVILLGHYASERFAIEKLAIRLQQKFSALKIWVSEQESDPIGVV